MGYKRLLSVLLALTIMLSVVPFVSAYEGGGGSTRGGGAGKRDEWLTDKTLYNPQIPRTGDNYSYLRLSHIDDSGKIWYQVMGHRYYQTRPRYTDHPLNQCVLQYNISETDGAISGQVNILASSRGYLINFETDKHNIPMPVQGYYDNVFEVLKFDGYDKDGLLSSKNIYTFGYGEYLGGSSFNQITTTVLLYGVAMPYYKTVVSRKFAAVGGYLPLSSYEKIGFTNCTTYPSDKYYEGYYNFIVKEYLVCTPNVDVNEEYDINTRIGSVTGDICIIDGDGNVEIVYENHQFIDESNNRFYDIQSNQWITYNTYSYDYINYSYTFQTVSGDTYTITYGDEYITYINTSNTYYYYYYIYEEPSPSPSPDPNNPNNPSDPSDPDNRDNWSILDFIRAIFEFILNLGEKIIDFLLKLIIPEPGYFDSKTSELPDFNPFGGVTELFTGVMGALR